MFMEVSVTQVEIAVELIGCFCEIRHHGIAIYYHDIVVFHQNILTGCDLQGKVLSFD